MEAIWGLLIKNKYPLLFTVAAVILEVAVISYLTKGNMLVLMALAVIVMAVLAVFLRKLGLETATLFLVLAIPYSYFIITNYFSKYLTYNFLIFLQTFSEVIYLSIILAVNFFKLKSQYKYDNKRLQIFGEIIIAFLLMVGNLFTFLIFKYSTSVFVPSTILYLKYFLIAVIIYYSNIDFSTLKKVLCILSIIIIVNFVFAILQTIFGDVFIKPFLGAYYMQERNSAIRAIGVFPWPTGLGAFSGAYFILYFFTAKYAKSKYLYIISGMCIANIILSQARLSLIICVVVLLISSIKKVSNFLVYIIALVILLCIIDIFVGLNESVNTTIKEYSEVDNAPRIYYVLKGFEVFKDNFIFGVGFDRFGTYWVRQTDDDVIFSRYGIKEFKAYNGTGVSILQTTDSFVAKMLPEMGLFGVGMFILLFVRVYKKGITSRKRFPEVEMFIYMLMFHNVYIFNSAQSMSTYDLGPTLWVSMGFIVKYYHILNCEKDEASGKISGALKEDAISSH